MRTIHWRNVAVLFFICCAMPIVGYTQFQASQDPVPVPVSKEGEELLDYLKSDNYADVRRGIGLIERNISSPEILRTVKPLTAIAKDSNGRNDAYTRSQVIPLLFKIGKTYPNTEEGADALKTVVDLMHNSRSELVRASSANVVGNRGYSKAKKDLESALDDNSIFVRAQACSSLLRMTDSTYSSSKCNASGNMAALKSLKVESFAMSVQGGQTVSGELSEEAVKWLQSHVWLPIQQVNQ
jgi:hypothetical protein